MTGSKERVLTRSSCEQDAGQGWREEAAAVIQDIRDYVNHVSISGDLPCNGSGVYFNIETKEGNKMTTELSAAGFRICGQSFDSRRDVDTMAYETIQSLLDSVSPEYRCSFASALARKLKDHISHNNSHDDVS